MQRQRATGPHHAACEAAAGVRMARSVGKANEFEHWLFANQASLSPDKVKEGLQQVAGISDFDARYADRPARRQERHGPRRQPRRAVDAHVLHQRRPHSRVASIRRCSTTSSSTKSARRPRPRSSEAHRRPIKQAPALVWPAPARTTCLNRSSPSIASPRTTRSASGGRARIVPWMRSASRSRRARSSAVSARTAPARAPHSRS